MADTVSLEELFRHAVTFPGPGAAIAGLQKALAHLEEELERAAAQITVRLRASHQRLAENLHPEDREYEIYDLDHTINVLLPRVVRGGFILTIWSVFEVAVRDLAEYAYHERALTLSFRRGDILKELERVFTQNLGIPAFPDPSVRERLKELREFRHALVHHNGLVNQLPQSLQRSDTYGYSAIGLHLFEDLRHQYVVPKAEFVHRALALISAYLLDLSERVYQTVHPTPLKDDA